MTSVVVADGGGNMVEYVTVMEETEQVRQYHQAPVVQCLEKWVYSNFAQYYPNGLSGEGKVAYLEKVYDKQWHSE